MPIPIECPSCAARYRIGDSYAGKRVKCKNCQGIIAVPAAEVELRLQPDAEERPARMPEPNAASNTTARAGQRTPPALPARDDALPALGELLAPQPVFAAAQPPNARLRSARAAPVGPNYPAPSPRPFRRSTAAPEGFSPLVALLYVVAQIVWAIYFPITPPSGSNIQVTSTLIWTLVVCQLVLYFAITTPLAMLGVILAGKAMRFEVPPPAYVKAAAIGALPSLFLAAIKLLPPNPVLILACFCAILPVTFIIMKLVFALEWVEAVVAFIFSAIGYLIGIVASRIIIAAIAFGAVWGQRNPNLPFVGNNPSLAESTPSIDPSMPQLDFQNRSAPMPSVPSVDFVIAQLNAIKQEAQSMTRPGWMGDCSREQFMQQLTDLQTRTNALSPQATTPERKAKLDDLGSTLVEVAQHARTLPSEHPDESVFQPITAGAGTAWQPETGVAGSEVSFRKYRLTIPDDAKVDLASSEDDPGGVSWDLAPRGRFTIAIAPRRDPRQERPWVKTHVFQKSVNTSLLTIDAVNTPVDVQTGTLGGLPATRIASQDQTAVAGNARFGPSRWVKFIIADGNSWLIATCTAEADDARTLDALEHAAWSIRPARADETRIDPFDPETVVARLREDRAVPLVRHMGSAAEPALLAHLDDSDFTVRRRVIELLGDVGTKKSVAPLLKIAQGDDFQYADLARAAVKKLAPTEMDDVAVALMELKGARMDKRRAAMQTLADNPPGADDPRRPQVSLLLTSMIVDRKISFEEDAETAGDALAKWGTPAAVPMLLPLLDHDNWDIGRRHAAMMALAKMKDRRGAFPIIRWLIEDTAGATKALITMGPVAEEELDKILTNKSAVARTAAANILGEIGTQKSLRPLANFVYDHRSHDDIDTGNAAIEEIKARIGPTDAKPKAAGGP